MDPLKSILVYFRSIPPYTDGLRIINENKDISLVGQNLINMVFYTYGYAFTISGWEKNYEDFLKDYHNKVFQEFKEDKWEFNKEMQKWVEKSKIVNG